jgi:S1/P1 Nuclease
MPLHCAALYSEQFPNGDGGGALFTLKDALEGEENTLHGLWDSCILLDYYELKRPLTIHGKTCIEQFAQEFMRCFPLQALQESADLDAEHWIQESYDLAVNHVYQGIELNGSPSEEYLSSSREIACRQLTLAGYRLSCLLNAIFAH